MLTAGSKRRHEDAFTKAVLALRKNMKEKANAIVPTRREQVDIYEPCSMSTVFAERLEQGSERRKLGATGRQGVVELKDAIINNTAGTQKHRELINVMIANRLAGTSFFSIDNEQENEKSLGIRFDSSYNGTYFETYYFVLQYVMTERVFGHHKKNVSKQSCLRMHRHTLPHFIPVQKLWMEHDFKGFIKVISAYINAFVTRREQLFTVEREFNGEAHREDLALVLCDVRRLDAKGKGLAVSSGAAKDTITITGEALKEIKSLVIKYDSLMDIIPATMTLTLQDDSIDKVRVPKKASMRFTLLEILEDLISTHGTAKKTEGKNAADAANRETV